MSDEHAGQYRRYSEMVVGEVVDVESAPVDGQVYRVVPSQDGVSHYVVKDGNTPWIGTLTDEAPES